MVNKYGANVPANNVSDQDQTQAFYRALLANTNRGGENVAPGSLIGSLLGASIGFSRLPAGLVEGLAPSHRATIDAEIAAFLAVSPFVNSASASQL